MNPSNAPTRAPSPPPSKSSIKEANQHLRELHAHNCELEEKLATQKSLISQQAELLSRANADLAYVQKQLSVSEATRQNLSVASRRKDDVIARLCKKCDVINEFAPAMEAFLRRLGNLEESDELEMVNPVRLVRATAGKSLSNGEVSQRGTTSRSFNITSNFSGSSDEDDGGGGYFLPKNL